MIDRIDGKHCLSKVSKTDVWSFRFEIWSRCGTAMPPATSSLLLFLLLYLWSSFLSLLHFHSSLSFCLPSLCFPSICLPRWAFPLKTKEAKAHGVAQTPAVATCNKPLFSIPLCTSSHFPISPHSLAWHFVLIFHCNKREAYQYFWLRNEINRQHPSTSCWNFPFFSLKKWSSLLVYYQKASILCWATHLLLFRQCLCSLMAGLWPASIYEINMLLHVPKETIFK